MKPHRDEPTLPVDWLHIALGGYDDRGRYVRRDVTIRSTHRNASGWTWEEDSVTRVLTTAEVLKQITAVILRSRALRASGQLRRFGAEVQRRARWAADSDPVSRRGQTPVRHAANATSRRESRPLDRAY